MQLHPDWPEFDPTATPMQLPLPLDDLSYALNGGEYSDAPVVLVAGVPGGIAEPITLSMVKSITEYSVKYHGETWTPGTGDDDYGYGPSELEMVLYGQLHDGRWFSVNAWNDYTGWGCQDDSQVRVADTEEQIIANGLDNEGRTALGLS